MDLKVLDVTVMLMIPQRRAAVLEHKGIQLRALMPHPYQSSSP
jgi:hypothetical protein